MRPLSDMLVAAGSAMLALSSVFFASYMIAYGPEQRANDFKMINLAAGRLNASRGEAAAEVSDPITTGTAVRDGGVNSGPALPPGFFSGAQAFDYRITRVERGTAYVAIGNGAETVVVPIKAGAIVPGIGFARALEQRGRRWVLVTGRLEITEDGISVAR